MRAMYHCTTWVTVYLWSRYICSSCGTVTSIRSRLMASCDSAAKAGAVNRRSKNQESRARILIKYQGYCVLRLYRRDLRSRPKSGFAGIPGLEGNRILAPKGDSQGKQRKEYESQRNETHLKSRGASGAPEDTVVPKQNDRCGR